MNKACKIEEYPREKFIEEEWLANRDSMNMIADNAALYAKATPYQYLARVIGDKKVIKYFQATLTFFLPSWLAFDRISERNIHDENIFWLPAWKITQSMEQKMGMLRCYILRLAYNTQNFVTYFVYLGAASLLPLLYFILRLKRGFSFAPSSLHKEYIVAMPVLWGVSSKGKNIRNGILKQINDGYLYGDKLKPGQILHMFGKWKFDRSDEVKFQEGMDELGYDYVHINSFKLTPKFITVLFKTQFRIIPAFLQSLTRLGINRDTVIMSRFLIKAVYYYLDKHFELTNVKYKIDLVKDDYNPAHVINSIVVRKYSSKSVGVQHTASPYDSPQLCFVEFDLYIVYGDFYVNLFRNCWSRINLAKTGREILDYSTELSRDKKKSQEIRSRFNNEFGNTKYRILVLLSGPAHVNRENMWREFYLGMKKVSELDMDIQVVLRLRELVHSKTHKYIKKIVEIGNSDPRFLTSLTDFSTQELMPICDLVITPNSSFGINEALAVGKQVFTFDLTGAARLYFDGYGKDLVMQTSDDLRAVFQGLENNFASLDCDWERLSKELNYQSDGNNCSRIRKALSDVADF